MDQQPTASERMAQLIRNRGRHVEPEPDEAERETDEQEPTSMNDMIRRARGLHPPAA